MLKKLKVILGIAALTTLCAGLAACAKIGDVEKYQQEGYDLKVTYDANGGKYYNRDGVSIVRMFKSEEYMQNGVASIKLSDPSVEDSKLVPTKSNPLSFFAGWYKTREIAMSANNKPLDERGRELVEVDGVYYVDGTQNDKEPVTSQPTYTYKDYWDFETSRFTITEETEDEDKSLTLYAGWVPYYQFNYYYQSDDGWVQYGTTSFDFKAVHENSTLSDQDTIFTPDWENGKMSYVHSYSNGNEFNFPDPNKVIDEDRPDSLKGKSFTFSAAYEDEACTIPIIGSLKHEGALDAKTYTITNAVKNVYVVFDHFEKYKISTPKQLSDYANQNAHFELTANLDFSDTDWSPIFSSSEFKGEISSSEGNVFTISNVKAEISGSTYGGLFGSIAANAVIKNVRFDNVTVDLVTSPTRAFYSYGLFAGNIDDKSEISNVTIGGTVKIGTLTVPTDYEFNLLANGKRDGITNTGISLQVYGSKLLETTFEYAVNPEKISVDESGNVTLVEAIEMEEREKNKEYFDIISSWRQNND